MELLDHQKEGLTRCENLTKCAFFWDMGTGKTFVGAEKMHQIGNGLNLLICQKSKIADWVEHFRRNYAMGVFDLTNKKRYSEFFETVGCFVGVINYELAWRRKELLNLQNFTLMLDESSLIQNKTAKQTKFILKLHPSAVILLSGTPTAGRYENLWTQAHLLGWDISEDLFLSQYVNWKKINVGGVTHKIVDKENPYKNVERLRQKLRVNGADFLTTAECFDLPEQVFQRVTVPASTLYKKFSKHKIVDLPDGNTLVGDMEFSERMGKRHLCGVYSDEKLTAFRDLVQSTNDRLIVFYNFTAELNAMIYAVDFTRGISVVNGSEKDLTAYENNESSITFVQYQAGAMGLNLQKACRIIYFSLPDGRSDLFEQSKKRIHRIGQKSTCFYYVLTCTGTIEEEIEETLNIRREYTERLF